MHEDDQYIKEFNQESYLKQRITKSIEKLTKSNRDIREKEVGQTMFQCLAGRTMSDMSFFDLNDIAWTIEKKMKDLCRLIGSNDGDQVQAAMNGEAALVVPPYVVPPPVVPVSEEDGMLINGEAGLAE
ncbi:agamous-like MADS-box protein AGL80 [Quillaja saponaria]|uniref:Agamous-like MADS-box protein AGL80 n=1 Tax=Quillaja saponaria TaxID=32244 RepID=A0AAD7Q240_QUISA|nr:agamous-like MADS-box protein AGL80 [Quillaja saponaria]